MIDFDKVPEKGTIYAVFVDKILYDKYNKNDKNTLDKDIRHILQDPQLLEAHLFNKEEEYRYIKIRTKKQDYIEKIINDKIIYDDNRACDDTYIESVYVSGSNVDQQDNLKEKVDIVNYIRYDDNDLMQIINYRLKEAD